MSLPDVKNHLDRFCKSTNAVETFGRFHEFEEAFFKSANSIFLFDTFYEQQFVHLVHTNGKDDYVKPIFEKYTQAFERATNGAEYKDYLLLHRPLISDATNLDSYFPRMIVTQYESRSPRIKSLTSVRFCGNFANTNYHHLSVTLEIVNTMTNTVAKSVTLPFLDASLALNYRLAHPKIMETCPGSLFKHDDYESWIFLDSEYLLTIKSSFDASSKIFTYKIFINNV